MSSMKYHSYVHLRTMLSLLQPHRAEKDGQNVRYILIQLPSDYDGGELRVRHRSEEQIFIILCQKGLMITTTHALFTLIVSTMCEVTRGCYRLCLVYNLIYSCEKRALVQHHAD